MSDVILPEFDFVARLLTAFKSCLSKSYKMYFFGKWSICAFLLLFCQILAPARASELGSDLEMTSLKPTFAQAFAVLPKLHPGSVSDLRSLPLNDPRFEWNSAGRYARVSPSKAGGRTGIFREPAMDWDPSQGAMFPNGDLIGITGRSPYSIKDGKLVISVDRIATEMRPFRPENVTAEFMSGQLNSFPFVQRYGYFEARLKLAAGKGLLAGFWLLPASGTWPPELGIMQMRGDEVNAYYPSLHSTVDGNQSTETEMIKTPNLAGDFHLFGMDWGPTTVGFYFDRKLVFERPTPADAHQPFYMILQLALGGASSWFGTPDSMTPFPSSIEVDYIKVWQRTQYESSP
jgi:hypothetical protein